MTSRSDVRQRDVEHGECRSNLVRIMFRTKFRRIAIRTKFALDHRCAPWHIDRSQYTTERLTPDT